MPDQGVTVVAPPEAPRLAPDAAKALLRILHRAAADDPAPSVQVPPGGRTSGTRPSHRGDEARRAS